MKKLLSIFFALALVTSMTACGGETPPTPPPETQVENKEMTLTFDVWEQGGLITIERTGTYTGTIQNDLPNGQGRFDTKNSDGDAWYYEGGSKNGLSHGQGVRTTPGTEMLEKGTYTDGAFTPNLIEFYNYLGQVQPKFSLNAKTVEFFGSNPTLFPAYDEAAKQTTIAKTNFDVQYKQLTKSLGNYLDGFHRAQNLQAMQVAEQNLYGNQCTYIFASSEDGNFYTFYYNGSIELYDGDFFEVYALPIANSSFDNIGGGTTNVIVMAASIINLA